MKPPAFRLAPLLRLREAHRDARRQELARAISEQTLLAEQGLDLDRQLRQAQSRSREAQKSQPHTADELLRADRYSSQLFARQQALAAQQQAAARAIAECRDALAAAEREVQAFDRLRQRRQERYALEQTRKANKQLDEIAARLHQHRL